MKNLDELYNVITERREESSEKSYTNALLNHEEKVYRKLNEETYEVIHACLSNDKAQIVYESGDLIYHLLVLLAKQDIPWSDVFVQLDSLRK